jgi:hypothetical protein
LVIPTLPVSRDRRVDAIQSRRFAFVGRVAAQLQEIRLRLHPREGGVYGADLGALLSASGSPGPTDIDFSFLPSFLPSFLSPHATARVDGAKQGPQPLAARRDLSRRRTVV